jgi:[ribosomal protein S5]-alanine N-acetyltransferase
MLELKFKPFPVLETEHLLLRRITKKDAEDIYAFRKEPEVMQYIGKPTAKSVKDVKELISKIDDGINSNSNIAWGITVKPSSVVIGTIGFHSVEKYHYRAEVGYMLNQNYWNKRLGSEALEAVLRFGFLSMNLHSIEAKLDSANVASKKLLTKFNFVTEAYFKENYYFEGQFQDTEVCSLLRKQFTKLDLPK